MAKATKAAVQKKMDRIEADMAKLCEMIYEACPSWPEGAIGEDMEVLHGLNAVMMCVMGRYMLLRVKTIRGMEDINNKLTERAERIGHMLRVLNHLPFIYNDFERHLEAQKQAPNN
jgi:hypothetical protein